MAYVGTHALTVYAAVTEETCGDCSKVNDVEGDGANCHSTGNTESGEGRCNEIRVAKSSWEGSVTEGTSDSWLQICLESE